MFNGIYPYNSQNGLNNAFNYGCQQLVRVNGMDGAKAYQMGANSTVALFDSNDDVFYVKVTDGAGFPTIRQFRFSEIPNNSLVNKNETTDYVTRKELEDYVKHIIQSTETEPTTIQSTTSGNGKEHS